MNATEASPARPILVVGRSGQLAEALAERAARAGRPLVRAGRPELDLARSGTIVPALDAARPGFVVNAAAYTAVDRAEQEPEAAFAINRDGVRRLAEIAAERDVPLIHVSTDYVFDGTKDAPYLETDPPAPAGIYGRSKLEGEEAVRAAGGRSLVLRTAWVYSPFGHNFVRTMLRLAGERDRLRVVDDQTGNPTSALDLADAILAIADACTAAPTDPWTGASTGAPTGASTDAPTGATTGILNLAPGELFHAAGGGAATWCGLAREIFAVSRAAGGPFCKVEAITTADYPTPAARPANARLDCGKLARTFDLALPDWHDSLAPCITRLLARDEGRTDG